MFEEEYLDILNQNLTMFDSAYQKYLRATADNISRIHRGYFSIDKKTGRAVNSTANKEGFDDKDISAYDLILKNKERLLSFEEPTRFIFSHSALPKGFHIPTPVGNYSPDWAIAFNDGSVKHIYFIAETKGTMDSLELRPIEQAKIACAKKLFNEISTSNVRYHDVDSYQSLLTIMNKL